MKNGFVRQDKTSEKEFLVREIVAPIFDKNYRSKPIEERWNQQRRRKEWFDPRLW